jgi:hypothetical protein
MSPDCFFHLRTKNEIDALRRNFVKRGWAILAFSQAASTLSSAQNRENTINGFCEAKVNQETYHTDLGLPSAMAEIARAAGAKLDNKVVETAFEIYRTSNELENLIGPQ